VIETADWSGRRDHAPDAGLHSRDDGWVASGCGKNAEDSCMRARRRRPAAHCRAAVKQGRAKGGFISQNERFMKHKWIAFFLEGVSKVSLAATKTARAILDLRERHRQMFAHDAAALRLLECLYEQPLVSVRLAQKFLSSSYNHAGGVVGRLVERGLLRETTGRRRNRLFRYDPYLALFT